MTKIPPATVTTTAHHTAAQLRAIAATLLVIASWSAAAWQVKVAMAEPVPLIVTGDAIRISQYVCRKNDGVRTIEPAENKIRFVCRDGAIFEDVVIRLAGRP